MVHAPSVKQATLPSMVNAFINRLAMRNAKLVPATLLRVFAHPAKAKRAQNTLQL